jgi:hypothetical protein
MMPLLLVPVHIVSNPKILVLEHQLLRNFGLIQRLSPRELSGTSQEELFSTILMEPLLEEVQIHGLLHTLSTMIKMAVLLMKQPQYQHPFSVTILLKSENFTSLDSVQVIDSSFSQ